MDLTLQISCDSLSVEELHHLARQLTQTIDSETDISAQTSERQPVLGAKGASSILGEIALTVFSTGGVAAALIGVFKAYFDRTSKLTFDIKRVDGSEINISAENMKPEQIEDTVARLSSFLKG